MKTRLKALTMFSMASALLLVQPPGAEASLTLRGTVPVGGKSLVIIPANHQPGSQGVVKLLLTAPTAGAYSLSFCVGPASNPCGLPTSYVVDVPGGEQRLAVVDASAFVDNILVVGQGTNTALPFVVAIE